MAEFTVWNRVVDENSVCLYCLDELRRGAPPDGRCGHEALNERDRKRRAASTSPHSGN